MTSAPATPPAPPTKRSSRDASTAAAADDGQSVNRRLLLVPKDKSFATQKFLVVTSGAIVAKDGAFIIAVEDQARGRTDGMRKRVGRGEWNRERGAVDEGLK